MWYCFIDRAKTIFLGGGGGGFSLYGKNNFVIVLSRLHGTGSNDTVYVILLQRY